MLRFVNLLEVSKLREDSINKSKVHKKKWEFMQDNDPKHNFTKMVPGPKNICNGLASSIAGSKSD